MIIIGLSAKKQGGKSTFIEYLKEKLPGSETIRFADFLKEIVLKCFVPLEWKWEDINILDSEENKNKTLPCGKTVREILQSIGTDWFRHTWEECWINCYKKKVFKSKAAFIFTPDVRFPNELKAIQEMGGYVIRLLRAPFGNQDQHESETALDEIEKICTTNLTITKGANIPIKNRLPQFDIIFDNRDMTLKDTQKWIDEKFIKCFSWNNVMGKISNPNFNLSRLSNE